VDSVIIKKSSYDYDILKPHVFEMLEKLGGSDIAPNSRVLIKPNFLVSAKPESAIVTHPLLIKAVVEYVLEKGGLPQISDSPAFGSFGRILKESGTQEALKGLSVKCKPFEASRSIDIGEPFGAIDIAEDALTADFVINLPKLKTHNLMFLTLGVKNLFGCVIGLKKPEWHFKMGSNLDMFARLLVRIHETIRPRITILDGILALEGEGPGRGGKPKHVGLLLGSADTYALDETVGKLLRIDPDRIPTIKCARAMGISFAPALPESELNIYSQDISDFTFPKNTTYSDAVGAVQGFARRFLMARPAADRAACSLCNACAKICPAAAALPMSDRIIFDYNKCIRCYCCTEVCPQGAIRISETILGKLFTLAKRSLNRTSSKF